jgi:hypothetical protein
LPEFLIQSVKLLEVLNALGKHTFEALTKLLTKRGECKTGLSIQSVELGYVESLNQKMRTKLGTIKEIGSLPERF